MAENIFFFILAYKALPLNDVHNYCVINNLYAFVAYFTTKLNTSFDKIPTVEVSGSSEAHKQILQMSNSARTLGLVFV